MHEVKLYPSYILYNMVQCQPPVKVQEMISWCLDVLKFLMETFISQAGTGRGEPRYKHLKYLLIGLSHYDGTVGQLILRVGTPGLEEPMEADVRAPRLPSWRRVPAGQG